MAYEGSCKDVQADEIWSYAAVKEKHITPAHEGLEGIGDQYGYVAIERHSKLVLNFALGRRGQATTDAFIEGLRHATSGKQWFQLSKDGFQPYISAITTTLSDRCDYAQHIKVLKTSSGEGDIVLDPLLRVRDLDSRSPKAPP